MMDGELEMKAGAEPAESGWGSGFSNRGAAALRWWKRLTHAQGGDPGALAQLRRCRSALDALRIREAHTLSRMVGGTSRDAASWQVVAGADLARVLAHVRTHQPGVHPMRAAGWKRFPGARRESDAGEDRPLLAEGRFRRLLVTGDGEELVDAFRRLIQQLGGTINVSDLASDFLRWNNPEFGDAVREQWAFLYFAAADAAPALDDSDNNDTSARETTA